MPDPPSVSIETAQKAMPFAENSLAFASSHPGGLQRSLVSYFFFFAGLRVCM